MTVIFNTIETAAWDQYQYEQMIYTAWHNVYDDGKHEAVVDILKFNKDDPVAALKRVANMVLPPLPVKSYQTSTSTK